MGWKGRDVGGGGGGGGGGRGGAEGKDTHKSSGFLWVSIVCYSSIVLLKYEPPRGKTNNVVSEQVRHRPGCTSTEKS